MEKYLHSEITSKVLEAFYRVYNNVGFGFDKDIYVKSMSIALKKMKVKSQTDKQVELVFLGEEVGKLRLDLFVSDKVLVKITSKKKLDLLDAEVLQNELKMSGLEVGLLLNFGSIPEMKRKVNIVSQGLSAEDLKNLEG